uniref:uncharacterized protein LOC120326793 isoform X2 n=1 Tax=Styela clava TaxID=7725 RepID=UPI00193A21DF|nr:uncharacterized protein LOC120326793 isoform X2 [Styela clava]
MPFHKPKPVAFNILVAGEEEKARHILMSELRLLGSRSEKIRDDLILESVILEVTIKRYKIKLQFWNALLVDGEKNVAKIFSRRADLIIMLCSSVSQDVVRIKVDTNEVPKVLCFAPMLSSPVNEVLRKALISECNAFVVLDWVTDLIKIVKRCIELSEKRLFNSLKEELDRVDLLSDKTNLQNSTLCYERNSIATNMQQKNVHDDVVACRYAESMEIRDAPPSKKVDDLGNCLYCSVFGNVQHWIVVSFP